MNEKVKMKVELVRHYTSATSMELDFIQFKTYPDVVMRTEPSPRDWKLKVKGLDAVKSGGDIHEPYCLTVVAEAEGREPDIRMWVSEWDKRYSPPAMEPDSIKIKRRLQEIKNGQNAPKKAAPEKHKAARGRRA